MLNETDVIIFFEEKIADINARLDNFSKRGDGKSVQNMVEMAKLIGKRELLEELIELCKNREALNEAKVTRGS